MRHFATLTDRGYLPRMLAMYESLRRHSSEPLLLHVLALDRETEAALQALHLEGLTVHPWPGKDLRRDHTWQEFCWLMASQWCEWLMDSPLDEITYLDADLFFFGDPKTVFDEIGNRSAAIVPHRFIPSKKYLERNGLFNVGWVTFRATKAGRDCLFNWARDCREWCYARNEGGKFGDQGYLDAWPAKYGDELCIIESIGVGLAPWNLANYELTDGPKVDGVPVVFYHFHEFQELGPKRYELTKYHLRPEDKALIYGPYIAAYERAKAQLEAIHLPA